MDDNFKSEYLPKHLSMYEKVCNLAGSILRLKPDKKKIPEYQEAIDICHLNITPGGAASFPIFMFVIFLLIGIILVYLAKKGIKKDDDLVRSVDRIR